MTAQNSILRFVLHKQSQSYDVSLVAVVNVKRYSQIPFFQHSELSIAQIVTLLCALHFEQQQDGTQALHHFLVFPREKKLVWMQENRSSFSQEIKKPETSLQI